MARNSNMPIARREGRHGDATSTRRRILVDDEEYQLTKFRGLNERTCQNHRPVVREGEQVEKGQLLADGAATARRRARARQEPARRLHALGRLQLRGRDPGLRAPGAATTRSPRSTSRSTRSRSARPSSARRSSRATSRTSARRRWRNLDESGIVRIGTFVEAGDILVGKVAPKSQERADARGEAPARDLRQGRRRREERLADHAAGHARRRDRRAEVLAPRQPDRRRAHARR